MYWFFETKFLKVVIVFSLFSSFGEGYGHLILLKQRQTHKQREIIHHEKFICFTLNYFMSCCIVPVPILGLFTYTYVALIHWVKIRCPLGTRPLWRCRSYSPCSCSLICILPYPNQLLKQKRHLFYFHLINVYIKWVMLPSVLSDIWYRDETIWSSILDWLILCCYETLEIIFTNIEKFLNFGERLGNTNWHLFH